MSQQKNKNRGITVISLVVTLIILIILATISISTLYGDGGLMSKSKGKKNEISKEVSNSEAFIKDAEQEYLNAMYVAP